MTPPAILGIDVSKATLDLCLLVAGQQEYAQFSNQPEGFKQVQNWLRQQQVQHLHVCLEATGRYGEAVAHFLFTQGYQVSVVNPARIKKYADSQLRRNKTDKLDASLIAHFCHTQQPALWTPPDPTWQELRALVRHRADCIAMRQQERNRLKAGITSVVVREALKQHIAFLDTQISSLDAQIADHINRHSGLKAQHDLLVSIPGIGNLTALTLLTEVRDFRAFDTVRELVAFAGLNPSHQFSGTSIHRKTCISKTGNAAIRKALYWPAISASRHNPLVKPLYDRLAQAGQPSMVAIVAAMRKLLHLAYGVLKTGQPFDPHYLSKGCAST